MTTGKGPAKAAGRQLYMHIVAGTMIVAYGSVSARHGEPDLPTEFNTQPVFEIALSSMTTSTNTTSMIFSAVR